ncbi:MAG TPA: N4-gp56 family major capsid protein [Lysobacter sp.]|nr:N4-gp56 family major capsid protein [Lysobacter sp.]
MAATNFAKLTGKQKLVWSRDVWSAARDQMFVKRFVGTDENSMIQRITELTRDEKGERCLMQLVADLIEDGVIGDNQREGNEEEMMAYAIELGIDLISHQVKNKGKMAEQKTVVEFRKHAKSRLAYWLANRIDQLVFLTLSGISYAYHNNGALRRKSPFPGLAFAQDVTAPSAKRHLRWDATNGLVAGDTTQVAADDTASYAMIVDAIAYAKDHYVKPLMADGKEYYVGLVRPGTLAALKKDPDYQRAVIGGLPRSKDNPWFTGAIVTVDGLVLHEHRLVYNTTGTATKWGAGNAIEGTRTLICGAQALGMADLGEAEWVEKKFDYDSKKGISIDKMFGLLKPLFYSIYDESTEDFGVIALDHAL